MLSAYGQPSHQIRGTGTGYGDTRFSGFLQVIAVLVKLLLWLVKDLIVKLVAGSHTGLYITVLIHAVEDDPLIARQIHPGKYIMKIPALTDIQVIVIAAEYSGFRHFTELFSAEHLRIAHNILQCCLTEPSLSAVQDILLFLRQLNHLLSSVSSRISMNPRSASTTILSPSFTVS